MTIKLTLNDTDWKVKYLIAGSNSIVKREEIRGQLVTGSGG